MTTKQDGGPVPDDAGDPGRTLDSDKNAANASASAEVGSAYAKTLDGEGRTLPEAGGKAPSSSDDFALTPPDAESFATIQAIRIDAQGIERTVQMTGASSAPAGHDHATVASDSAIASVDGSEATIVFSGSPSGTPAAKAAGKGGKGAPAQIVPGYVVLSELGRGGMGVVYKARQLALGRTVALKMVIAGAHASPDQLARFHIEAEAIAHLQHPDMVQIYDIGDCDGLPYFSLEYVEGGCLTDKIGGRPMPPRAAAEMLLILAGAMQAAHDKGIIHRDLKPANVLLTKAGRPKITDFGLAKRMEGDSQQTRSGAIMGTPSYMAPEQAWGHTHQIGPLADQYALGAILYEMLVGRPPYQGANPLETLDLARTTEPVPPTRLQPKIPIDLETICLKALQKESGKRYDDCAALAADVQRFLDGKPILARPISAPERLKRWCLRNPRVAVLSGLVAASVVLIVAGSVTAAISFAAKNVEVNKARKVAVEKQLAAETSEAAEKVAKLDAIQKRTEAEKAKAAEAVQTRIAVDQKEKAVEIAKLAMNQTEFSLNSLRFLSVLSVMRLKNIPGTAEVRAELLKTAERDMLAATKELERVAKMASEYKVMDSRLTQQTLVGIYLKTGQAFEEMGRFEEAGKQYAMMDDRAEALFKSLPNDPEAKQALAYAKCALGDFLLTQAGKIREAAAQYQRALKLRRELLAYESTDSRRRDLAQVLGLLGRINLVNGNPVKALEYYEEERGLRDALSTEFQQVLEVRRELAGLCEKLGEIYVRVREPAKGREACERSLNIRVALSQETAGDPDAALTTDRDLLASHKQMGVMNLVHWKDPAQAKVYFLRALDGFEKLAKTDPNFALLKGDLAMIHYVVATLYLRDGDRKEAATHYQACLKLRQDIASNAKSEELRIPRINLMLALARCGKHEEASRIAASLIEKPPQDPHDYFQAACGYALSAGAVAGDRPKEAWSAEDAALIRKYADEAIASLRKGAAAGYRSVVDLETDPDLDPIRTDPGFVALLEEFRRDEAAARGK